MRISWQSISWANRCQVISEQNDVDHTRNSSCLSIPWGIAIDAINLCIGRFCALRDTGLLNKRWMTIPTRGRNSGRSLYLLRAVVGWFPRIENSCEWFASELEDTVSSNHTWFEHLNDEEKQSFRRARQRFLTSTVDHRTPTSIRLTMKKRSSIARRFELIVFLTREGDRRADDDLLRIILKESDVIRLDDGMQRICVDR